MEGRQAVRTPPVLLHPEAHDKPLCTDGGNHAKGEAGPHQ